MYRRLGLQERALLSHISWVREIDEKGQRAEKDTHQDERASSWRVINTPNNYSDPDIVFNNQVWNKINMNIKIKEKTTFVSIYTLFLA